MIIVMVVLIRNGGGHCNNDVVSPAMQSVAAFRTPIPTSCQSSLTLESALIFLISCFLRSSSHPSQVYDPKFTSPEAFVIKSDFSYNLDYCKCLVTFNPLKRFINAHFSVLTVRNKCKEKFNPESIIRRLSSKVNYCYTHQTGRAVCRRPQRRAYITQLYHEESYNFL